MGAAWVIATDPDEQLVLAEVLGDLGLTATLSASLTAPPDRPAIVLSNLGGAGGYDATKARSRVRALRHRLGNVPIVLLTAYRSAIDESDRLGADAILAKPYDIDELQETIRALLRDAAPGRSAEITSR